jgi:hypothetical protein
MKCKKCNNDVEKIVAKGFCGRCYAKDVEERNSGVCVGCKEYKPIKAKGMCRKCYMRYRRHGNASNKTATNIARSCSYCGDANIHAKGLCSTCYARNWRTGSLAKAAKKKHLMGYMKNKGPLDCVSCGKEFRPRRNSQRHCSRKCYDHDRRLQQPLEKVCKNEECRKHFSTTNRMQVFCSNECKVYHNNTVRETREARAKECFVCGKTFITTSYHGKYCSRECQQGSKPVKSAKRAYDLKTKFKLTQIEYNAMLDGQDGVCAICGGVEKVKVNGVTQRLAVDHDHKSGEIRGLLCINCNTGLGRFKDSKDLLTKAIKYLK